MSMINFMLSWVEYEKFYNLGARLLLFDLYQKNLSDSHFVKSRVCQESHVDVYVFDKVRRNIIRDNMKSLSYQIKNKYAIRADWDTSNLFSI